MKRVFIIISLFVISLIVVMSCSEDKSPLQSLSHPDGWGTTSTENFHGTKVLDAGYVSCKSCHGTDLKGGKSQVSCFDCHQTYPHPKEWNHITDSNFHGAYIKQSSGSTTYCKSCHGAMLTGGRSGVSCYGCHPAGSFD